MIAPGWISDENGYRLRSVAGCVQYLKSQLPESVHLAVSQPSEREQYICYFVHSDVRARSLGQLPSAGNVVGVDAGVDNIEDAEATRVGQVYVLVDVEGWSDHHSLFRLTRGDDIGRATAVFVENLLDIHDLAWLLATS